MIKSILAVCMICLFTMGQSCVSNPTVQAGLASTCDAGTKFYGYVKAASATGFVKESIINKVDGAWGILEPICEDPAAATDTDIVMAGVQLGILIKAWKDAA